MYYQLFSKRQLVIIEDSDRLGRFVIDQSYDAILRTRYGDDYAKLYNELWQSDVKNMILRDRNHPSVIIVEYGSGT